MSRWPLLAIALALPATAACGRTAATGDVDASSSDAGPEAARGPGGDGGGAPEGSATSDAAPDSADAEACGDSAACGAFSPAQVPGLVLWLDDDQGVLIDPTQPGLVARWQDQSGGANDAVAVNPAATVDPKALNGHDGIVMTCQSSPFTVANAPSLDWGVGDFTIVAVAKLAGDGATLWQDPNALAYISLTTAGGDYKLTIGPQQVTLPIPSPGFDIVVARGQAMRLAAGDASAIGPTTTTDVSPGAQGVFIGFCSGPSQVEIAELLGIGGPLSDDQLGRIVAYLKAKFAL
jgi:hypothetical protein